MGKTMFVAAADIRQEGLQVRARVDLETVKEYATAEREGGAVLPPVVVFLDAVGAYWLADGHHRVEAARLNGRKKVACEVRSGSRVDALRFALGANGAHGLRRTNADKANAVKIAYENRIALGLGEVPSANGVAELVGVSNTYAGAQLATVASWREATERVGADGKVRTLPPVPTRKAKENDEKGPKDGNDAKDGRTPVGAVAAAAGPPPVRMRPAGRVVDSRGVPVPSALVEMWNRRGEVGAVAALVSKARAAVRRAEAGHDPLWGELNVSSCASQLDMAYAELSAAQPWCVCPMCQGVGCKACKGRGLMGEYRYKTVVPKELKGGAA